METLKLAAQHLWAIQPSVLEAAIARITDGKGPEAASGRSASRGGSTVVMPLQGVLRQKGSTFMDELFGDGGGSTERFASNIRRLAADEGIGTIVLDVHSPGGEVFGTAEAADAVFEARQGARIVAVVNSLAASAAYWIASQAHEIWVSPSSLTGSIGVFAVHEDISQMAERMGVKVTMISAGKYKTEGNQFEPLTDEAKTAIQKVIDGHYSQFVSAVARGRKVSQQAVRGGMGQGRVVSAKDAVSLGMADRMGTLQDALASTGTVDGMKALGDDLEYAAKVWPREMGCQVCGGHDFEHPDDVFCEGHDDSKAFVLEGRDPGVEREQWEWAELAAKTG